LFVTVAGRVASANLTPASRRQDHTTSPSASSAVRPQAPSASTASRPASVTIASRPSCGTGRGESIKLFLPNGEAKNFAKQDWTGKSLICPSGKSVGLFIPDQPRHSGAMPTGPRKARPDDRLRIELRCAIAHRRISRFRVQPCGPPRNDGCSSIRAWPRPYPYTVKPLAIPCRSLMKNGSINVTS
jgi:hypothetical protein